MQEINFYYQSRAAEVTKVVKPTIQEFTIETYLQTIPCEMIRLLSSEPDANRGYLLWNATPRTAVPCKRSVWYGFVLRSKSNHRTFKYFFFNGVQFVLQRSKPSLTTSSFLQFAIVQAQNAYYLSYIFRLGEKRMQILYF